MSSTTSSSGIGLGGLLGVAFVVLKITGYIDWSWWYVTLPFWGGFMLFILFASMYALILYLSRR